MRTAKPPAGRRYSNYRKAPKAKDGNQNAIGREGPIGDEVQCSTGHPPLLQVIAYLQL
jgi:hypothetical protein